ncbi:MAG: hypothetical protein H5T93_01935 [Pseudothermotoga sp.]|nr:hypothetical protein [Pseudothermotoga sp.]
MWSRILANYGIEMSKVRFMKNTFLVAIRALFASSLDIALSAYLLR